MVKTTKLIRTAVAEGKWSEAERLLEQLRGEVETAWVAAGSDAEREAVAKEVGSTLDAARIMVMTCRAHDQARFLRTSRRGEYSKLLKSEGLDLDA